MSEIRIQYFPTPHGELVLGALGDRLCVCDWRHRRMRTAIDSRIQKGTGATYVERSSPVTQMAEEQLKEYFAGGRRTFDIPLEPIGTDFQKRVWQALLNVPYGSTMTYASLTATVAEPTAIRAVASANGANALSIFVPCHRIIGSSGELVGYAGGLPAKRKLLELEGAVVGRRSFDLFSVLVEE